MASYAPVDAEVAAPHGVPCSNCGYPLERLDKFCTACGSPNKAYDASSVSRTGTEASQDTLQGHLRGFQCQGCGAELTATVESRSVTCPFCDSNVVVEFAPDLSGKQLPEYVIGFAIKPDQAQAEFRKWLSKGSFFHPGDLAMSAVADRIRGIYLPFWSFSTLAQSNWEAMIGMYWYRTETYTTTDGKGNMITQTRQVQETEWWPLAGNHHYYHSGFMISASKRLTQGDALKVMPFQLPALKRYEPFYLAGWYCENYSVDPEVAQSLCLDEFYRREQNLVEKFLPGDTYRQLRVRTDFSMTASDLCLLPIYMVTYRYKGKMYRFLMNGQTGKIDGHKPLSPGKIAMVIFFVLLAIFIMLLVITQIAH